ncbi:hypothetical protein K7N18_35765, partial [Burkholderia arboris]|uniref:hypothetical protein n=1 Tax=Burkholderia arboris TaxID=488730 RepID=UPI001CA4699D
SANAICSSVNLLVFMAWPSCPLGHIMPNFSTFEPDYFLGQGQITAELPYVPDRVRMAERRPEAASLIATAERR